MESHEYGVSVSLDSLDRLLRAGLGSNGRQAVMSMSFS